MEIGVAENLVEQAKIKSTQMSNSLNKKWWIPREESLGKEGNTSKKLVKDVLIYIKDNFEQFPRGGLDLNAITINIELRKTWPYNTRFGLKPFALAVSTYCLFISSRKEFFVNIVKPAKPPMTIDVTGSTMCHK